jgi:hypothetical protein
MTRWVRSTTAAAATVALAFVAFEARADGPTPSRVGDSGELIVSADRLMPFVSWSSVQLNDYNAAISTTNTQTSVSLFYGATPPLESRFFTVPRAGLDYVLLPNFTVGGNIVLYFTPESSQSVSTTAAGVTRTASADQPGVVLFGVAPRAGYVLHLNNLFGLWLRGGVSLYTETTNTPLVGDPTHTHESILQPAIDLEPQIFFQPVAHLAFTATIDADIPVFGQHSLTTYFANGTQNSMSAWASTAYVGLTLGMLGYF